MVGPSIHDHSQTFGRNGDGTLTKVVLNFRSLRHPGGEEETSLAVGPIDKELLRKEAAIKKLERTTFEQVRMIKEMEAKFEVLQREAKEEEQTGIFDVKAERVETESNEARAMELEAQMFEAERARAR